MSCHIEHNSFYQLLPPPNNLTGNAGARGWLVLRNSTSSPLMSDFRRLQEFIVLISEACRPFADVSVRYLQDMASKEYATQLATGLATSYQAAIDELTTNLSALPVASARISYLNEVRLLTHKHAALNNFVMRHGKAMFETLLTSGDQRTVGEQAYAKLYMVVQPGLAHDVSAGLIDNSLSNQQRGHIALLQVVGTGAYNWWKQLAEEIDRQFRLLTLSSGEKRPAISFNEAHFLVTTGMEKSMLTLIDTILLADMNAIQVTTEGTYELVDSKGKGRPLMALMRMLIALKQANEPEQGHRIEWIRFFESRYQIPIGQACSRYQIASANKFFQEDLRSAYRALTKRIPPLLGPYPTYQALLGSYR